MIFSDGRMYIGNWENDKQSGEGELILSNGSKRVGIWKEGVKVEWEREKGKKIIIII